MSADELTLSVLRENSDLPDQDMCHENGCSVQLDRMSERVVFRPDDSDISEPRADCAIFFPERNEDEELFRDSGQTNEAPPAYLAIVELKNTISRPSKIEEQIHGALEFAINLLEDCIEPPWDIRCLCLVAKNRVNTYRKTVDQIRFRKHIHGTTYIFNPVIVDSGYSVRSALEDGRFSSEINEI